MNFFDDSSDQIADSGTAINLLKQKFPGMFADAGTPPPAAVPFFAGGNSAPTAPGSTDVDPNSISAPNLGQPSVLSQLPWMRQFQGNKADKLAAVLNGGLPGAMTGQGQP